jgi:hypothetical protein
MELSPLCLFAASTGAAESVTVEIIAIAGQEKTLD